MSMIWKMAAILVLLLVTACESPSPQGAEDDGGVVRSIDDGGVGDGSMGDEAECEEDACSSDGVVCVILNSEPACVPACEESADCLTEGDVCSSGACLPEGEEPEPEADSGMGEGGMGGEGGDEADMGAGGEGGMGGEGGGEDLCGGIVCGRGLECIGDECVNPNACRDGHRRIGDRCTDVRPARILVITHQSFETDCPAGTGPGEGEDGTCFAAAVDGQLAVAESVGTECRFDGNNWLVFGQGCHLVLRHPAVREIFSQGTWNLSVDGIAEEPRPNMYWAWISDDVPGLRGSAEMGATELVVLHANGRDNHGVTASREDVTEEVRFTAERRANGRLCLNNRCVQTGQLGNPNEEGELRLGADNHLGEDGMPDRHLIGRIFSLRVQFAD